MKNFPPSRSPSPAAAAPARIGRFQVIRELGRGSVGVVYLARDPVIDREVAIKTLRTNTPFHERKRYQQQFVNEARAAGRLSHPCVVTIFEAANEGDTAFIVMEYLKGRELSKILANEERYAAKDVALIVKRLALALDHAHTAGVVHRDIKPANIFMLDHEQPKLVDFGIARAPNRVAEFDQSDDEPYTLFRHNVMGTPNYMAPEQALGKATDLRSDIYSLGVVMYEMLTGRKPFDTTDTDKLLQSIVHKVPTAPHDIDASIPLYLSQIAMKALNKKPEDRYQNASDIVGDIKRHLVRESRKRRTEHAAAVPEVHKQAESSDSVYRSRLFLMSCLAIASAMAFAALNLLK